MALAAIREARAQIETLLKVQHAAPAHNDAASERPDIDASIERALEARLGQPVTSRTNPTHSVAEPSANSLVALPAPGA